MYAENIMHDNEEYTEETMQDGLLELICEASSGSQIDWEYTRVGTFAENGVLTYNKGLVITTPDGSEFQLTIVQSR